MIPWHTVRRLTGTFLFIPVKIYCAYHLFETYVGGPRMVYGPSMVPTFSAVTDWILEDTLSVHLGRPLVRGQVVVLKSPRTPGDQICKRIIGLPGDVICVDPIGTDAEAKEHVIIPQGHIWIAGDNSAASIDSRVYGPVPMALVRARVVAGIFPWRPLRPNATVIGEDR